jgi:putative ABC transport system permease protein
MELNTIQLTLSCFLMGLNLILSFALKLNLSRQLLVASFRMVVQLLLLGQILHWIFALESPWLILAVLVFMSAVAGFSAVGRTKSRYPRIFLNSLLSVGLASMIVGSFGVFAIFRLEPWYQAQYVIPIIGMMLGNILNGISLGLDRFMSLLEERSHELESRLAMGATRWEAARSIIEESVRVGMVPILNSMMVMGLVSLPGMMTGQILAGANPIDAVKYQIVIVFMIASATACGSALVILLSFLSLSDKDHRFLLDRLKRKP